MKSRKADELSRFNMPFELSLDIGIRSMGTGKLKGKKCLVIDEERYRYQAALSDIGGSDIAAYGTSKNVENLIEVLRNWLSDAIHPVQAPASHIYLEFNEFMSDLQIKLMDLGFDDKDFRNIPITEYQHYAKDWIDNRS